MSNLPTFTLTENVNAERRLWEKRSTYTLQEILLRLYVHDSRKNKDGPCFLPGTLYKNQRLAKQVLEVNMLVYDIDGEQTLDEIIPLVDKLGVVAIAYTSHSHLTTRTSVNADTISNWMKKEKRIHDPNREEIPTLKDMLAYLEKFKPFFKPTNCSFKADVDQGREASGKCYYLNHDPVHKFRLVFPLKKPIIMDRLGAGSTMQLRQYAEIYHGVGTALGLRYDEACSDPSRIFYFPSTPNEDTASRVLFGLEEDWYENFPTTVNLLDYEDYPRYNPKEEPTERENSNRAITATDKNGKFIDLRAWSRSNFDFDIESMLEQTLPDELLRGARARGGLIVGCPYEDENHTKGADIDVGAFAANGDGDQSWTIHCAHNSCKHIYKRNRLDYLAGYIAAGYIVAEDLGIKGAEPLLKVTAEQISKNLGVSLNTLPKEIIIPDENKEEIVEDTIEPEATILISADEGKSEEDVYREVLMDLKICATFVEAKKSIDRLKARGVTPDYDDIVGSLAESQLSLANIKQIGKFLCLRMPDFSTNDFVEAVLKDRGGIPALHAELNEIILAAGSREGNIVKYRALAERFGMPFRDVKAAGEDLNAERVREAMGDKVANGFKEFRGKWAKVKHGNTFSYIDMDKTQRTGQPYILSETGLRQEACAQRIEVVVVKNGKSVPETVTMVDYWLKHDQHKHTFDGLTFEPKGPMRVQDKFNVWSEKYQYEIEPRKGDCSRLINHIREVWCDNDEFLTNWTLMWFADIIQNPQQRPMTALLIMGNQGTGKSIIGDEVMMPILGKFFGKSAKRDDIVGKFNSQLAGKLFWLAEETLFAGDRQSMQVLKDMITSPTVLLEPKGVDKYPYPSYTRFMFTSNMLHALHLEEKDRRFVVLKTSDKYIQNTDYFESLTTWLRKEGRAYFLDFLINFKPEDYGLKWTDLRKAPLTDAKREQVEMSFDTADMFFMEILKYGRISGLDERDAHLEDALRWGLFDEECSFIPEILHAAFEAYLVKKMGPSASRFDRNKFTALMRKYILNGDKIRDHSTTRWIDKKATHVVRLPKREVAIQIGIGNGFLTQDDLIAARNYPESHRDTGFNDNE